MKYNLISGGIDGNLDEVIEWLNVLDSDAEIERIASDQFVRSLEKVFNYEFSDKRLDQENESRWWIYKTASSYTSLDRVEPTQYANKQQISRYLDSEKSVFLDYFFSRNRNRVLGYTGEKEINKLKVLAAAKQLGINIPETLITTSKQELLKFYHSCKGEIINKPISNCFSVPVEGGRLINYTERVELDFIENLPDTFGLSLFQRAIKKKFEVRSFLLDTIFYSMAIFSQKNTQTQTDFRIYDKEKPNRNRSMQLPNDLESKLLELASIFRLNTGSFDLLVDQDTNFIFLEVNPSGQFGMVSKPCNYYLEREIALFLSQKDEPNG